MKRLWLVLGLCLLSGTLTRGQTSGMEIGVRSGIDNGEKAKRDHDSDYATDDRKRLRRYFLASIKEMKTDEKLVKPMDARGIADELRKVLAGQGFRAVRPGEKPEIILTVLYGRGMVLNPYLDPDKLSAGDYRRGLRGPPNLSNSLSPAAVLTHHTYVGLEAKTQVMNYEKLAIQISAMKYPPPADPKQKPELLWQTMVYADDPDHRDLNTIMPKLLASAAPYFDKHIEREQEVKIYAELPTGRVKVGSPEVVTAPRK